MNIFRDWIDNSETVWCTLIKTSRSEPYTYYIQEWIPCPLPIPGKPIFKCPYPEGGHWEEIPVICYKTVNYPSDGLLPTYAQELKGVDESTGRRYTIDYANHMELRNMSQSKFPNGTPNDGTENKLRAIFSRGAPDWFRTETK